MDIELSESKSRVFKENWDFGEKIKRAKLFEIIEKNKNELIKKLKTPKIKLSSDYNDKNYGIDYFIEWDIPIAFRARRCSYNMFSKKGGSFTLRSTGSYGKEAEVYKMINGKYKAEIYVFIWACESYGIIDIPKWIKAGIIQRKMNEFEGIPNKNRKNKFLPFTLKELINCNCIIKFHNANQKNLAYYIKEKQ